MTVYYYNNRTLGVTQWYSQLENLRRYKTGHKTNVNVIRSKP